MTAKKVYYLACAFCRWTSRDIGLQVGVFMCMSALLMCVGLFLCPLCQPLLQCVT